MQPIAQANSTTAIKAVVSRFLTLMGHNLGLRGIREWDIVLTL